MSGQSAAPHCALPCNPRTHRDVARMDVENGQDPQASRHYSNGVYYAMLINVIIGAGVFSLPFGFHNVGSLLGAIFIFFFYGVNLLCVFYVFEALARADSWMKYVTSASEMEGSSSDKHALLGRGHDYPEGDINTRPDPGDDSFRPAVPLTSAPSVSGTGAPGRGGKGRGVSPSLATMREVCRMGDMKFSYVQLYEIFCGRTAKNVTHTVLSLFIYSVMWAYTGVFASSVSNIVFRYALGRECDIYDDESASEWTCKLGYYAACVLYAFIVIPLSLRDVAEQATVQVILMCYRFLAFAVMLTTVTVALIHQAGISQSQLFPTGSPSSSSTSLSSPLAGTPGGLAGASITALGAAANVTAARVSAAPPPLPRGLGAEGYADANGPGERRFDAEGVDIGEDKLPHRSRSLLSGLSSMGSIESSVTSSESTRVIRSVKTDVWGASMGGDELQFTGPQFGSSAGAVDGSGGNGVARAGGEPLDASEASGGAGAQDTAHGRRLTGMTGTGGAGAVSSRPHDEGGVAPHEDDGHGDGSDDGQKKQLNHDKESNGDKDPQQQRQQQQQGQDRQDSHDSSDGDRQQGALSWMPSWLTPKFGAFFGSVAVAFNCICYLPEVVHPVHPHKGRNLQWVAALSLATSTLFYLTLGLLCALLFRERTEPLVTLNWKDFTGFGGGFGPLPAGVARVPFWALLVRLVVMLFPVGDMISVFPIQAVTLGNNLRSYVPDDWVASIGAHRVKVALRMLAAIPPLILGSINGKLDELFAICGLGAYLMAFIGPAVLQLCSMAVMRRHLGPGAEVTAYSLSFFGGNIVTMGVLVFGISALAFSTYVLVAF